MVDSSVYKHILSNGSIVLLLGAFAIGAITKESGLEQLEPFIIVPFTGVLTVFLLDMGLSAGRSLISNRKDLSIGLFASGCLMPLVASLLGWAAGFILALS